MEIGIEMVVVVVGASGIGTHDTGVGWQQVVVVWVAVAVRSHVTSVAWILGLI
mgnify:CR=1 FL=1